MKKMYAFAVLFCCIAITSFAQVTTSNIRGLVVDDQNQPLPGASVVAIHTPTGTKYGGSTNFDGRYNLLNMRVGGPYTVTVSYVGFNTQEIKDIFLTLGKTYSLDLTMIPDTQQLDEVVVRGTGGNNIFGNDRTGSETSVGRREITTLPTIARSQADFTRLEPSSSAGSFGGRNDQFNNFSLDGAIFNNPFGLDAATPGGQTDAQPVSLDAIDQIQVSLAPYDVTQAGFTGASVNAVTKSGTNEFHGTVYGFYRDENFTGRKVKDSELPKVELSQRQYGFSLGGPIVKNKLFFFVNFEEDKRDDLGQTFLPNRGTGAANESRVLESDLITVQEGLRAIGYEPGAYEGFIHEANSTKGIFKLDWNINDKNRLALIYNFLNAAKDKPAHPSAIQLREAGPNRLQFQNSGYQINNKLKSVQLELNSNIGENMTNKFQVGYTHFDDFRNPFSTPAPSINITRGGSNYIIAGHEPFSVNNRLDQKVFQMTNNLNIFSGDHTFTVGFSYERFQFDNSFNLTAYGFDLFGGIAIDDDSGTGFDYIDDSTGDFIPSVFQEFLADRYTGAIANAEAVFAANNAVPAGTPGGWTLSETNVGQLSFYVQDDWNITDRFKVTYGVRFDKPLFFDSAENAQDVIDRGFVLPDIPYFNPNTGENVLIDNTQMPDNKFLISPRLGFNWDVNGDDTFQLRGGSGLFTGRFPFVWLGNQIANPDVFFLQAVDPDYQFPQVWRTNIGADKRFESGLVLTADVSYTKDINGPHVQNWGLRPPTGMLQGVDNRPIYEPADIIGGAGEGPFVFTNSDKGRIWNASFKAQKTWENDLYAMVAYNYLDAKDVNSIEAEITSDAFAGNPAVGNVNNDVLSHSRYGDTHRIIGAASKKWTYGNDNWSTTLSTFFEYAQGGRFNYVYGGDLNRDGSGLNDLLYIPTAAEVNQMQFSGPGQAQAFESYIQQDDYLSERRGQYAERYAALSPWRGRWDMKFIQELKIFEDQAIQFSVDVLNVGNLINSDWGVIETLNNRQPLGVNVDASGVPTYTFDTTLTETFGSDTSLLSRWQMQFGLRYIF
ncbi:MAG: TonB-dependent receptor [Flavobacteriaceae bacterium]|nr:TonB-dependent receptor [Flavobacteriaceae bacterium]